MVISNLNRIEKMEFFHQEILSIDIVLEELLSSEFGFIYAGRDSELKPKPWLTVAITSEARENFVSTFNKLKLYFKERSGIFISSAHMWSTLVHHNTRGGCELQIKHLNLKRE